MMKASNGVGGKKTATTTPVLETLTAESARYLKVWNAGEEDARIGINIAVEDFDVTTASLIPPGESFPFIEDRGRVITSFVYATESGETEIKFSAIS